MNKEKNSKNKKTHTKLFIILIIAIIIVYIVAKYTTDEVFRYKVDTNILKKEVSESNLPTIELDSDTNPYVYAYDKYISILSKNKLTNYNSNGENISDIEVNISIPLFDSCDKYLALADKNGENIYLISGTNILWSNSIEGEISQISVNKNGYVSVVIKNSIYKSIVAYYDLNGIEIFRTYISSSYVICSAISANNKYLAIGEIDYSGTIIKSYVKIISVELAQTTPENSIIYTYESENNEIITNMNYKDNNAVICMFNNYIQKVTPNSNERLLDINSNDNLFVDINLKDYIAVISKQSSGLFSYEYDVKLKSTSTSSENLYILNSDLPKSILVSNNNIALNLGNEVQIINSNGWLLKKYTSSKQISNIVLGNSVAGIIYKNKIEIINL